MNCLEFSLSDFVYGCYNREMLSDELLTVENNVKNIVDIPNKVILVFENDLIDEEITAINNIVSSHKVPDISDKEIDKKLDKIESVYEKVRREFVKENIKMGITQLGQTQLVLDAFVYVDYAMRNWSLYEALTAIDNIERVTPFLTEERLTKFKRDLLGCI